MDWRVGLTAGLLALAIVFGWSAWNRRDTNTASAANADTRPDYVMRDFELTRLNEDGSESLTLRAPLLERHPGDQTMNLQAPLFLLPGAEDHPWQLRADTGWLSAKGDELRLNGNVVGDSPEGGATPTRFETQQLNVYPRRHLANSDAKVVITRPGSILSGVGFEANTQTERYILKSQVVSRYAPPSRR